MLTSVYHPLDGMRVVEADEAQVLMKTGDWFDSPALAKEYRAKVEQELKDEEKAKSEKKKPVKPKNKPEGKTNEKL